MATFQSLLNSVRVLLSDKDEVRYSNEELMEYANEAMYDAQRMRPDLFIGALGADQPVYELTDTCPLPQSYVTYAKDYIVARAETRDDEFVNEARAVAMLNKFRNGLMGV